MKTLQALKKTWIFWLDRAAIYTLPVGTLFAMFLVFTQQATIKTCVIAILSTVMMLSIAHQVCLYHFVKCPECGWNLALFKDGKKIQPRFVYNAFKAGRPCLKCGWEPFKIMSKAEKNSASNNTDDSNGSA